MSKALNLAIQAIKDHDSLPTLMDKLRDCQGAKWERLLRNLVKELTDDRVIYAGCDIGNPECGKNYGSECMYDCDR